MSAVDYTALGWPVAPLWWPLEDGSCACGKRDCDSPGKHPHGRLAPHGLDDATTDPAVVQQWWTTEPRLNVGLRTGIAFDVLDLDNERASMWLACYAVVKGYDTEDCWGLGPMSLTGKGAHLLYAATGAGNRTKMGGQVGLDWRGKGGYIVAPPSLHYSGHRYAWHEHCGPDLPIPKAPAFLAELVVSTTTSARPKGTPAASGRTAEAFAGRRGSWSPSGVIGRMATAVDGERNNVLWWAARAIGLDAHDGKATEREALDALDQLATVAERTGLKGLAVDKTIRSGYSTGRRGVRGQVAS